MEYLYSPFTSPLRKGGTKGRILTRSAYLLSLGKAAHISSQFEWIIVLYILNRTY